MARKQKLELTWIGKETQVRLEPRILIENPELSYHASALRGEADRFDNLLIHGDNLLALKALEQEFAGKVKCIYIDPPYNTGSAFEHYDDGIEHSLWLSLMRDRLAILRDLLSSTGVLFCQIDDNEHAYLKVLLDEIFGRKNFITSLVWQKKYAVKSDSQFFSESHEYILVYSKNIEFVQINRFPRTAEQDERYNNPDNDPRGPWTSGPLQRNEAREYAIFPIASPITGKEHIPPAGTSWRFTKDRIAELIKDNRIWFGTTGNNVPRLKRFLSEVAQDVPAITWWDYKNYGNNDEGKREIKSLFSDAEDVFATPKPERLIERILTLGSNPGDLVLDSFLGSGTTAAVAHKMGRRWIGIELGNHSYTHCIPRMQKVIDGTDQGGISTAVNWRGGGGFRFYELGPSLIQKDKFGNAVINPEFNAPMLAEAMCKLEGFIYAPSQEHYFIHGHSTERDFIFVTTSFMTREMLHSISEELGPNRSLLICCKAFSPGADNMDNLTLKKIPLEVLQKCEWDHDDYSLEIKNLPMTAPASLSPPAKYKRKPDPAAEATGDLFGDES